jgi:hypothetical protein
MSEAGSDLSVTPTAEVAGVDEVTIVDILDRVIGRGAVLTGDVVLGVAGVDLVHIGLRVVIRTVDEPTRRP